MVEDDASAFPSAPGSMRASGMGLPMDAHSPFSSPMMKRKAEADWPSISIISTASAKASSRPWSKTSKEDPRTSTHPYAEALPSALVFRQSPIETLRSSTSAANTCAEEFDPACFCVGALMGTGLFKGSCRAGDGSPVHLVELMTAVPALTIHHLQQPHRRWRVHGGHHPRRPFFNLDRDLEQGVWGHE